MEAHGPDWCGCCLSIQQHFTKDMNFGKSFIKDNQGWSYAMATPPQRAALGGIVDKTSSTSEVQRQIVVDGCTFLNINHEYIYVFNVYNVFLIVLR